MRHSKALAALVALGSWWIAAACDDFGSSVAPPVDDASADATDAGTAEPRCTIIGTVRADFEDGGTGAFDNIIVSDGGAMTVQAGVARARVAAGDDTGAWLGKDFPVSSPTAFGEARLRFTVKSLAPIPGVRYAELGCGLRVSSAIGSTWIRFELRGNALSVDEGVRFGRLDVDSGQGPVLSMLGNQAREVAFDLRVSYVGDGGLLTEASVRSVDAKPTVTRVSAMYGEPDSVSVRCGILNARADAGFSVDLDAIDIAICAR